MSDAAERQKRFDALREQTGRLLRLPADHPVVVRRAGDWLMYEGGLTGYIETGHIDLRAYVQLSELNERNQPTPPTPAVDVKIEVVGKDGVPISELPLAAAPANPSGEPVTRASDATDGDKPLPDNITRLPDGRASWTSVVSHGGDPAKPQPFSKPSREWLEMQDKNRHRDIHQTYSETYRDVVSDGMALRQRDPQARVEPRDPFMGGVGGKGHVNPFSVENRPFNAAPPLPVGHGGGNRD